MRIANSLPLISALTLVGAWDLSFISRAVRAAQQTFGLKSPPVRIAVIGAGAGGSSAAFWIQKAKERHGLDVIVDVYEQAEYIGGRSTVVYPYDDETLPSQELGGSVFVAANKNLMRAVEEFGLTLVSNADGDDDFGVWDGKDFVVTFNGGWWDKMRMLYRYGYSAPTRTTAIVLQMIETLLKAYTPELPSWSSVEALNDALGFTNYTSVAASEFFTSRGVGDLWVNEIIDAATRVNYGQDVTFIHGLGGAVSMAANGATQVEGGNFQIYEQFLKRSKANVNLNTTISKVSRSTKSGKASWILASASEDSASRQYDHVILGAPFHSSKIVLNGTSAAFSPRVNYVRLHVTLLSTTAFRPNPERFGVKSEAEVPKDILTTSSGIRNGGPAPEFQSISNLGSFERNGKTEHVFKVFSLQKLSDGWLESMFGESTIGWVHRKVWNSYPKLSQTSDFPPIKADDGLWYINSLESFVSTMETEVLSARNVVENVLREAFGRGICTEPLSKDGWSTKVANKKVYGWDC